MCVVYVHIHRVCCKCAENCILYSSPLCFVIMCPKYSDRKTQTIHKFVGYKKKSDNI
eukprot:UN11433